MPAKWGRPDRMWVALLELLNTTSASRPLAFTNSILAVRLELINTTSAAPLQFLQTIVQNLLNRKIQCPNGN